LGDQYRPDEGGTGIIENVTFTNNLLLKEDYWPEEALIQPVKSLFGDVLFLEKGGTNIQDYTPTNIDLVRNKGINIPIIEGDAKGLYLGLPVQEDLLGNPINGLPDMGAIELK